MNKLSILLSVVMVIALIACNVGCNGEETNTTESITLKFPYQYTIFLSTIGFTALKQDYRLGPGSGSQRLDEPRAILHPFNVGGDDLGIGVASEVLYEIRLIEVVGVSIANNLAKTDTSNASDAGQLAGIATALGDKSHRAALLGEVWTTEGQA